MRNKLSRETNVRIIAEGVMGPKEIGKLIKLLEAQKAVLEDDDEVEEAAN
jgi:ribosomal protein S28E/S33